MNNYRDCEVNLLPIFGVVLYPTRLAVKMGVLTRSLRLIPSSFRFLAFSGTFDIALFFLAEPILFLQTVGMVLLMKSLLLLVVLALMLNLSVQIYFFLVLLIGGTKRIFGFGDPEDPICNPRIKAFMNVWS